jgi:hypothetical protein
MSGFMRLAWPWTLVKYAFANIKSFTILFEHDWMQCPAWKVAGALGAVQDPGFSGQQSAAAWHGIPYGV